MSISCERTGPSPALTRNARCLAVGLCVATLSFPLLAAPKLQLYVEGAEYDQTTETWVASVDAGQPIRLWTIGTQNGNTSTDGSSSSSSADVIDVRLSILFDTPTTTDAVLPIPVRAMNVNSAIDGAPFVDSWGSTLAPELAIGQEATRTPNPLYGGGSQPNPDAQVDIGGVGSSADCIQPPNSDCSPVIVGDVTLKTLATHGEFTTGRSWGEWQLQDFKFSTSTLTGVDDFSPDGDGVLEPTSTMGLIYGYEIDTSAFAAEGIRNWHFDLYGVLDKDGDGLVGSGDKAVFAPFSHDAGGVGGGGNGGGSSAPEPASMAMAGVGLGLLGLVCRRRRRRA